MKKFSRRIDVCPKCRQTYHGLPTISRLDIETPLCPDRATREALSSIGISQEEQEEILSILHGDHRECA